MMSEYENVRLRKIEENKRKMEALNLTHYASRVFDNKQKIQKTMKANCVSNNDEYVPDEEEDQSSDEGTVGRVQTISRPFTKKVMASGKGNNEKIIRKPQVSTPTMASFIKTRSQTHTKVLQQDMDSFQMKSQPPRSQNVQSKQNGGTSPQDKAQHNVIMASEKDLSMLRQEVVQKNVKSKMGQVKAMVAPGTLQSFIRMREKSRENARLPSTDVVNMPMENSQKASYSRDQLLDGDEDHRFNLVDEDEESDRLDDYGVEELVSSAENFQKTNESTLEEENLTDQLELQKEKRTRGPTICREVNGWTLEERRPIFLNEKGQPIGPNMETLKQFSQFYGTLARDPILAPLNFLDWRHVPNKGTIWDYVKKKFIISEEGKKYVVSSVGALWRSYKSRLKKMHYSMYDNKEDRWINRPEAVPDATFKVLLDFWDLEEAKKISERNKKISEAQKDRHTMGPISFAIKRHKLEQAEKKPPSKAAMYMETRKRKEGKNYKTSYVGQVPESGKNKLLGLGTKKEKQSLKRGGVYIPDEVLQPYKSQIVKETLGEVMKFLKDLIPSEMFASISSSMNDQQTSGGINDKEQCQDDEGDDGANIEEDGVRGNELDNGDDDVEENVG